MLDRIAARTHNKECERREFEAAIHNHKLKLPRIKFRNQTEPETEESKQKQDKAYDYLSKKFGKTKHGSK